MARPPNYRFERSERDRSKAAKLARKAAEKAEARDRVAPAAGEPDPQD